MADKKKKDNLPSDSDDLERKVEELERQKSSLEKKLTNLALKVAGLEKTAYDYSMEKCSTRVRWSRPELPMLIQNSKDKSLPEPRDQQPKILHLLDSDSEISAESENRFKHDSKKISDSSTPKKQRDSTLNLLLADDLTIDSSETGQVLAKKDPRNSMQQQLVKNQQEFDDNSVNDPDQKRTNRNTENSREGTYRAPNNQYNGDADNLDDSGGMFKNKPKQPRQQDKVFNVLDSSDDRDKSKRSAQTSKQGLRQSDPKVVLTNNNAPKSEYYIPKSVRQDSSSVPPEDTNELSKNLLTNVNKSRQPRQHVKSSMIDSENTVNESGITNNKPTSTQDYRSQDRSKPKHISSRIDIDASGNNLSKLRDNKTRSPSKDKVPSGNMSKPSSELLGNVNKPKSKRVKQSPINQDDNDGETGTRGKNNNNVPNPNQDPRLIIVIEPQNNTNSNVNISISEVPSDKNALKYIEDKPKTINRDSNFVPSNKMNELGYEFRPDLNKRKSKQDENMNVSEPKAVDKKRETGSKAATEKTKPPFEEQDTALILVESKERNPRYNLDKYRGEAPPPEEYTSQPKEGRTRTSYQDSDYVPLDNSALNRYTRDNKYRGEAAPEKYISPPKEGKTKISNQNAAYSGGNKVLKKQNQQGSGPSGKPFSMLDSDESFSDTASKTDGDVVLLFTPTASSNLVTGGDTVGEDTTAGEPKSHGVRGPGEDQSKDIQKSIGEPDEKSIDTSSEEIEPISQESLKSGDNDGLKCAEDDENCKCQKILRENGEWRKNVNSILETLIMNSYGDKCPLDLIKDLMDPAKRDNAIKQLTARMNLAVNELHPGDLNNIEEPDDKKATKNQNEGARPSLTVDTKEENLKAKPLSTFDEYPPYPPALFEGRSEPVNRNENKTVSVSRSSVPEAISPCSPRSSGRPTPPCQSNQSTKSSYQCVSTQNKIVDIVCPPGSRPVIHIPSRMLPPPSVCPRLTENVQVVCCSPKNPCPKHK